MPIGYSRYTPRIISFGDVLVLVFTYITVYNLHYGTNINIIGIQLPYLLYVVLSWIVISNIFKTNDIPRIMGEDRLLANLIKSAFLHSLVVLPVAFYFRPEFGSTNVFAIQAVSWGIALLMWRLFYNLMVRYLRSRGLNFRRVVIIGGGHMVHEMHDFFINRPSYGYRLQKTFYLAPDSEQVANSTVAQSVQEIEDFCIENQTDEIYCSLVGVTNEQVEEFFRFADRNLIRFKVIPDFRGFMNKQVMVDFYETIPILVLRPEPLQRISNRIIKRVFDVVLSVMVILILGPTLLPLFAILIKLSSKGPVFFRQLRTGREGKPFTCYKFRTMRVNIEADKLQATKRDPRITAIGAFLRKTSLDELPQFWNTLIGDMTVVGPRPHMLKHTEEYSKKIDKFMVRHFAKPGITGWAQVKGFRGETSEEGMMDKRIELDVWYVENYSPWLDIEIILLTIWVIARGQDKAY